MEILLSCSHISTTAWLHHLDFNEIEWELHKDALCYFKQILEAVSFQTAAVWPLTFYLTNHSSKTSKTCWAMLEKLGKVMFPNVVLQMDT